MRSHSLVADLGRIVCPRKPDIPVKDGALSEPFLLVSLAKSVAIFASAKMRAVLLRKTRVAEN